MYSNSTNTEYRIREIVRSIYETFNREHSYNTSNAALLMNHHDSNKQ